MYIVATTSVKSAEKNGGGKAYLARLSRGIRGSVSRAFIRPKKINKNRKALESNAQPGDVFECRRWLWNMQTQQYEGGTIWFAVQSDGTLFPLSREEALLAVGAEAISSARPKVPLPAPVQATRLMPDDVRICEARGAKAIKFDV